MTFATLDEGLAQSDNVAAIFEQAMDAGEGLLRLTPTWAPRSFLHPGRRIKLNPGHLYAFGADRGGIDERWFSSTTEAANEGLSMCLFEGQKFLKHRVRTPGESSILRSGLPSHPNLPANGAWQANR